MGYQDGSAGNGVYFQDYDLMSLTQGRREVIATSCPLTPIHTNTK